MNDGRPSGRTADSESPRADSEDRQAAVRRVVLEVYDRRLAGEVITDSQVIAANRHLLPDLADALRGVGRVIEARHETASAAGSVESLKVLSPDELDRPIEPDDKDYLPTIAGLRMIRPINRGGQAAVYLAQQESTGRNVAVKIMWGGAMAGQNAHKRFDREVRILAELDHPAVVPVVDRGQTPDGSPFYVMAFVDGPDLSEHIRTCRQRGRDGLAAVLATFAELAEALQAVHDAGILHRDLKPANVRIAPDGRPRILDFGLASAARQDAHETWAATVTATGQFIGSLPWASPEQADGNHDQIDRRSDIYSLGVMLYHALTGAYPYEVHGPARRVIEAIMTATPQPPSQCASRATPMDDPAVAPAFEVDARIDGIVMKALAKAPDQRYATMEAFADDLRRYLAGRSIAAPIYRSPRARRRRRITALAVVFSVVAGIALGAIVTRQLTPAVDYEWQVAAAPLAVDESFQAPRLNTLPLPQGYVLSQQMVGGTGGKQHVVDAVETGGRLVGLRYAIAKWSGHDVVSSVQPIYTHANRVGPGAWLGRGDVTNFQTVIAKQGYAVGAIGISGGRRVDGFQIRFDRVDEAESDLPPSYLTAWIGGRSTSQPDPIWLEGDGPVTGIHARLGQQLDAVGIVSTP